MFLLGALLIVVAGQPARAAPELLVVRVLANKDVSGFEAWVEQRGDAVVVSEPELGLYRVRTAQESDAALAAYAFRPVVASVEPDRVLARVGEVEIRVTDLLMEVGRMPPAFQARFAAERERRQLVESMVQDKLFARAAEEQGLTSEPRVRRELAIARERAFNRLYTRRLKGAVAPPTDQELRAYYESQAARLEVPGQVRGARILVDSRELAEEIRTKLVAGASFQAMAKAHSRDPSKAAGGRFEWASRSALGDVADAVFALAEGELSPVIPFGRMYLLVRLEAKRAPGRIPFDEVAAKLRLEMMAERAESAVAQEVARLSERYGADLYPQRVDAVGLTRPEDLREAELIEILQGFLARPH